MKTNLSSMTEKQLDKLKADIEKELQTRSTKRLADARKAAEAAAKKHGFSLSDVVGKKSPAKKARRAAKYRDPDNSANTWSGRGRQPAWYKAALAAGKAPESMAI